MSVRRILAKTINTDLEYEAIGIDLAKNCVSVALLTTDGEVVCIDRLDYSELEKSAQVLCPTTFAMEPCTEMNYLVQKLEAWGHRCLVIGGKNVQNYVENHYSGQKTDLNDAQALAFLAQDTQLRTIKAKDMEQQKYASLTTLREQYIKQYRQTIVSLKGICQAWGLNISKGISGKARLKDLIENHAAFPEELKESLVDMVTHAQAAQKALNKITKTLELLAKNDKVCQLIQTIPGLGLISLKYANGLRIGANSDTHRCKQLTEHGEERCIKLREVAGFSAVRTIFQIVGPRKILHCLLGK